MLRLVNNSSLISCTYLPNIIRRGRMEVNVRPQRWRRRRRRRRGRLYRWRGTHGESGYNISGVRVGGGQNIARMVSPPPVTLDSTTKSETIRSLCSLARPDCDPFKFREVSEQEVRIGKMVLRLLVFYGLTREDLLATIALITD
ncbi:hypothetical protein ACJJTC_001468 [Scirpophaga incertulas]